MAQNVKINGVTYQNVPSVQIPYATGTGNAEFFDTSDATLDAGSKMLNGVTAYSQGVKYTGSIATKESSDLTVSGATVTAPAGYYATAASKSVASGSAKTPATTITANPTITVSSAGLITASVSANQNVTPTVSAGYVSSGTSGAITVTGEETSQLETKAAATIVPTTTAQTIPSGTYLTGAQTISGSVNLVASNIKSGVDIFGVTGTLSEVSVSQDSTTKVLSIA